MSQYFQWFATLFMDMSSSALPPPFCNLASVRNGWIKVGPQTDPRCRCLSWPRECDDSDRSLHCLGRDLSPAWRCLKVVHKPLMQGRQTSERDGKYVLLASDVFHVPSSAVLFFKSLVFEKRNLEEPVLSPARKKMYGGLTQSCNFTLRITTVQAGAGAPGKLSQAALEMRW